MFLFAKVIEAAGKELQDRTGVFRNGFRLVAVVADGAGGMSGGAEAAEHVVGTIKVAVSDNSLAPHDLGNFLITLDRQMAEAGTFGETTCVLAMLVEGKVSGASVGDSAAWMINGTAVDDLTVAQVRKPLLGSGRAIPVPFSRESLDGTLLIASDGLIKYAGREQIVSLATLPDLNEAAGKLMNLVRYPSGSLPDDVSLILVRNA